MLTMEVEIGEDIRDACVKAVDLARIKNDEVTFKFNSTSLTAKPNSDPNKLHAKFNKVNKLGRVRTKHEEILKAKRKFDKQLKDTARAIKKAKVPTEKEMREVTVPTFNSMEELTKYINSLVNRPHDYGTCAYAMSMAATATFNYIARKLGVTGFQASCAEMDILRRTRGFEFGKVVDYSRLLFPQYCNEDHFPSANTLLNNPDILSELAKKARIQLEDKSNHPISESVKEHWRGIIAKSVHNSFKETK